MICGSRGSKSRLAKAAGAEPAGQMRDEKLHAAVARSTFASQNVQNTWVSEHFWKLRCRKSARPCNAKHISKSKCTKHLSVGPLLEAAMSKKCMPLWREAHFQFTKQTTFGPLLEVAMLKKCMRLWREADFQVKMYKTHHVRTTFGSCDDEKVHAVVARSTFRSENAQDTPAPDDFWKLRCRKSARSDHFLEVQMSKKCTRLWREAHFEVKMLKTPGVGTPFLEVQMSLRFVHYTTLHYTTLHYTTLHYTTLHNTTTTTTQLHSTTLHYTPVH